MAALEFGFKAPCCVLSSDIQVLQPLHRISARQILLFIIDVGKMVADVSLSNFPGACALLELVTTQKILGK